MADYSVAAFRVHLEAFDECIPILKVFFEGSDSILQFRYGLLVLGSNLLQLEVTVDELELLLLLVDYPVQFANVFGLGRGFTLLFLIAH